MKARESWAFWMSLALAACGGGQNAKPTEANEAPEAIPAAVDADGDGWPADSDCDDNAAWINPSADEHCEDVPVDSNCDGDPTAGAVNAVLQFVDADGDGCGDHGKPMFYACYGAIGATINDTPDCNDADPAVNPYRTEVCDNGIDDDCDAIVDNPSNWYPDQDEDGYGAAEVPVSACGAPAGLIADGSDCDDADPAVNPEGTEAWDNGVDDNCDGRDGVEGASNAGEALRIPGASAGTSGGLAFAQVDHVDGAGGRLLAVGGEGYVALLDLPLPGSLDDGHGMLTGLNAGRGLVAAGDSDGDGLDELLVPALAGSAPGIWVVEDPPGGDNALDDVAAWVGTSSSLTLQDVAGGGDMDGDGLTDAVAAWSSESCIDHGDDGMDCMESYAASILPGPIADNDDLVQTLLTGGGAYNAGYSGTVDVAIVGDTDADGYDDLVINFGRVVFLVPGRAGAAPDIGAAVATFDGRWERRDVEPIVAAAGDVDGDGRADLLYAYGSTLVAVAGPIEGTWDGSATWGSEAVVSDVGGVASMASSADGDGDGIRELWVGAPGVTAEGRFGRVADAHLQFGATTTQGDDGAWYGTSFASSFGSAVAVGPFADATDSLLIGAPSDGLTGALYLAPLP